MDRRADCLSEFAMLLEVHDAHRKAVEAIGKGLGLVASTKGILVLIDDGKKDFSVHMRPLETVGGE